jgi:subtilisin family serine protease
MRRHYWNVVVMVTLAVILGVGTTAQAKMITINGKKYDIAEPGEFKAGEVIIRLQSGLKATAASEVAAAVKAKVKKSLLEYDLHLLALPPVTGEKEQKAQVEAAVAALERLPQVAAAYPNFKFSIPKPPDRALPQVKGQQAAAPGTGEADADAEQVAILAGAAEDYQWHLDKVRYYQSGTPPTNGPTIAILDTGVDYLHPDLSGQVLLGKDFVDNDLDPMDEHGHGTHCAGVAAAKGTYMVRGISSGSMILAVRVLDELGSGWLFDIMQGFVYARNYSGVKILSCSFGGYLQEGTSEYNDYKKVVDDTVNGGKIVCAAAGNEGNTYLYYYLASKYRVVPAWFPNTFTVGATNEVDSRAYFSNYDVGTAGGITFNFSFVDLVAPGWNILSTYLDGQVARLSGTSMACPLVAGAAARVWAKYPTDTRAQLQNRLVSTGTLLGAVNGFPSAERRVNLMKALGLSATGFVGIVYNGKTGRPLYGATVKAYAGNTLVTTVTTDRSGMFVATGLTGGTTYRLNFTKSGFGGIDYTIVATSGNIVDLSQPVVLTPLPPAGQWSVTIKYRSWHPGYWDAYYSRGTKKDWYPYYWYDSPGTYFGARLYVPGFGFVYGNFRGSLTQEPFAAMTSEPFASMTMTSDAPNFTIPVISFVISKVKTGVYKVWTRLDNNSDVYYEWGKYKLVSGKNDPKLTAYVYYGSTLKSTVTADTATGSGAYWYVGDINGSTFTKKNVLQTTQP